MFRAIKFEKFPPFDESVIEFPTVPDKPNDVGEVHLFTGVNGTGKTRLLTVLAAMLGNPSPLVKRIQSQQNFAFSVNHLVPSENPAAAWARMAVVSSANPIWQQSTQQIAKVVKLPAFAYTGAAYVSDAPISAMGDMAKPARDVCLAFNRPEASSKELLQAITNLKLQAAMDSMNNPADPPALRRAHSLMKALERALSEVTGMNFFFNVTSYPKPSVGVIWGEMKLPFAGLPDGLRSIIGSLAHALVMLDVWLQGKADPTTTEAILLLDEIESHLHPAWQRKILPAFQKILPKAQFFVTTHSPFVIASLNHGWIHSFKKCEDGKVNVEKPILASRGDSYVTVVEEMMGIKEWFDPETEKLLADFRAMRDSAYRGDKVAETSAREIAFNISKRSTELEFMMGRELIQMERQLSKSPKTQ